MFKKYSSSRVREVISSERAEAMPAAIITAIVSSILLLSVAGIISVVLNLKTTSTANVSLDTVASNVDVSLRSDISAASDITASATLVQPPNGGLINQSSINVVGVNLSIPSSTGSCKQVDWMTSGTTITRSLTIYKFQTKTDTTVSCDTTSPVLATRTKTFAKNINLNAPFQFTNAAGRPLTFALTSAAVTKVNNSITQQQTAQGYPLTAAQFAQLNSLLDSSSFTAVFVNPTACPMNAAPVNGVCPAPESPSVTAAWNSLKIAKVSVKVTLYGASTAQSVVRDIAQNSSVPLYTSAAQASAALATVTTSSKPTPPTLSMNASPVVLGTPYMVQWGSTAPCPNTLTTNYLLYQNGKLTLTTTSTAVNMTFTDSSQKSVNYTVQQNCTRGAMTLPSDMSSSVGANVVPAKPTLSITNQPPASNAALNANLAATGTCLYGTQPRYTVAQTTATYGTPGTVSNLTAVNMPINNGMQVVEGARYQYQVTSWCISAYASSSQVSASTGTFTTVATTPTQPVFTAPGNNTTGITTNATLKWTPVTCAVGTTVKYYLSKYMDHTMLTPPTYILGWSPATSYTTSNAEGHKYQYNVAAHCEGTAVNSNATVDTTVVYTTLVTAPAGPWSWTDNWGTMYWNAVTCAPGVTIQYRVNQIKADNNVVNFYGGWTSNTYGWLPGYNTGGYPQWVQIQAYCQGLDASSTISTGNVVKWVKNYDITITADIPWRRLQLAANCPYGSSLSGPFNVYVAADGWFGYRDGVPFVTPDGNTISEAWPGGGGNSGWVNMNATQNTQWLGQWYGTWHWGYYGQAGWGSYRWHDNNANTDNMLGTYWNATGWGSYAWWYYGTCSTPYMNVTQKDYHWWGGGIRNMGNPWTQWNAVNNGRFLTTAGQNAIK